MSLDYKIDLKGLEEAIRRNPAKVREEASKFIARGLAEYRRHIQGPPWRVGGGPGGAPRDTGHLRDTHMTEIAPFEGRITPKAPYAIYVHEKTKYMEARPWLNYAKMSGESRIQQLQRELLEVIVKDLSQ